MMLREIRIAVERVTRPVEGVGINFISDKIVGNAKSPLSKNFGKEQFLLKKFTTPNELFKDVRSLINEANQSSSNANATAAGNVIKDSETDFKQPFVTSEQSFGLGSSAPVYEDK